MRIAIAAASAFLFLAGSALAADTHGEIKTIDSEKMTITLDDGQTYKLPAEMDISGISEGTDIVIAYRERNGVKEITDMVFPGE